MNTNLANLAESSPDLAHPFQWRPGREAECSHFYTWLGGQVMCGLPESSPLHHNGPHLLVDKDGEKAYCSGSPETCEHCARDRADGGAISWDERNLQVPERRRPRKCLADMTVVELGEALSDMNKAAERLGRA